MKKIAVGVILLILVSVGIFLYLKETRPELFINIQEVPPPEVTIDTSDWKEFRSEELGISFRTPADWNNVEEEGKVILNDVGHDYAGAIYHLMKLDDSFYAKKDLFNFYKNRNIDTVKGFNNNQLGFIYIYSNTIFHFLNKSGQVIEFTGALEEKPAIIDSLHFID